MRSAKKSAPRRGSAEPAILNARLDRNTIATAALLSTAAFGLPTDVASVGRCPKPTPSPRVSRPGAPPKRHPETAAAPPEPRAGRTPLTPFGSRSGAALSPLSVRFGSQTHPFVGRRGDSESVLKIERATQA